MIYLTDERPNECPKCAKRIPWNSMSSGDFFAGASATCVCGTHMQYVPTAALLALAGKHGDMTRYVEE